MNAEFFGLALLAALNPKLLGVDLLLIENARPRPMFVCFLLGGMGLSLTVGLLDVFVLQADAISTQGSASAALDLVLGVLLVKRVQDRLMSHARELMSGVALFAGAYMVISGLVRLS